MIIQCPQRASPRSAVPHSAQSDSIRTSLILGLMHIALVLLFGSKVVHASDFSSGFEDVTPGTLLGWTLLPEPGSILAADATPTISASFVPWLDGAVPMARVIIDGSEMTGIDTAPETVVLSLAQPLPEGPHEILVILSHQGVETQSRWSFHTQTAPQIHGFAPVDGLAYDEDNPVQVRADFSDVGAGIDPAQVFIDRQAHQMRKTTPWNP